VASEPSGPGNPPVLHLTPLDPRYPTRLRVLARLPSALSTRGGPLEAACAVAVVGARKATDEARQFAGQLAAEIARAGAVVVSGGAFGIDEAAHRGALGAGGRTWVVAGTGSLHCFPPEHAALFEEVASGPGAMVWPFAPQRRADATTFPARNRVLVGLSDEVVVVQAGARSGALHAAGIARRLGRPLWVVPAPPWASGFEGSRQLLADGARPLTSIDVLLRSVDAMVVAQAASSMLLSPEARSVMNALSHDPAHLDEIASKSHVSIHEASAALLTLALENVVVEGPAGFFRRAEKAEPMKIAR